jgi:hypothetical protein
MTLGRNYTQLITVCVVVALLLFGAKVGIRIDAVSKYCLTAVAIAYMYLTTGINKA